MKKEEIIDKIPSMVTTEKTTVADILFMDKINIHKVKDPEIISIFENFGNGYHPKHKIKLVDNVKSPVLMTVSCPFVLQAVSLLKLKGRKIRTYMLDIENGKLRITDKGNEMRDLFLPLSKELNKLVWGYKYSV